MQAQILSVKFRIKPVFSHVRRKSGSFQYFYRQSKNEMLIKASRFSFFKLNIFGNSLSLKLNYTPFQLLSGAYGLYGCFPAQSALIIGAASNAAVISSGEEGIAASMLLSSADSDTAPIIGSPSRVA